jgi:hypothetical protein
LKAKTLRKRARSTRTKRTARARHSTGISSGKSVAWIRELAAPYLRGYKAEAAHEDGLQGFWFIADASAVSKRHTEDRAPRSDRGGEAVGFFVGYLLEGISEYAFLKPEAPECIVFAWIDASDHMLHEKLVRQPGSLVRKTFEYIRWLTHRPPRFVFHEAEAAAMARHSSMKSWPAGKHAHMSRNFFIETLAWLVRSGLVRKLREEGANR